MTGFLKVSYHDIRKDTQGFLKSKNRAAQMIECKTLGSIPQYCKNKKQEEVNIRIKDVLMHLITLFSTFFKRPSFIIISGSERT